MEFVSIPGGEFEMGDLWGDGRQWSRPVHKVVINGFQLGKYHVTQDQWIEVMGANLSQSKGGCHPGYNPEDADHPVVWVSWDDTQEFIEKLNSQTGRTHRLPTEAEWEYAARSCGRREKWAGTTLENELGQFAWFDYNSEGTHPVGLKKPNGLGLYDMCGNVFEWCQDIFGTDYYIDSPTDNPQGLQRSKGIGELPWPEHKRRKYGELRIFRGGGFGDKPKNVRVDTRVGDSQTYTHYCLGFRLVLTE